MCKNIFQDFDESQNFLEDKLNRIEVETNALKDRICAMESEIAKMAGGELIKTVVSVAAETAGTTITASVSEIAMRVSRKIDVIDEKNEERLKKFRGKLIDSIDVEVDKKLSKFRVKFIEGVDFRFRDIEAGVKRLEDANTGRTSTPRLSP